MEVNNFTGRMSTDENRAHIAEVTLPPLLQHKLKLLIHAWRRGSTADKDVSLATTGYVLHQLDKNISIVNKKQQGCKLHKTIQTHPSSQPA
jgi:hypothetical protein